uniref:Uncharacterized protein n=1 Tax=Eutreptiella gymnastica TaxID=73025 RepID=A0A7S4GA96_9EUGL
MHTVCFPRIASRLATGHFYLQSLFALVFFGTIQFVFCNILYCTFKALPDCPQRKVKMSLLITSNVLFEIICARQMFVALASALAVLCFVVSFFVFLALLFV